MSIPIYQIDAFTGSAFKGNPAAVCLLDKARPAEWMQNVAAEMNLSETAFIERREGEIHLRWFTPSVEVDLCGHGTLASAQAVWDCGWLAPEEQARFHTRSGVLTAVRRGDQIEMNFPSIETEEVDVPYGLTRALGAEPVFVGKCGDDLVAVLEDAETVRNLKPSFAALLDFAPRLVTVTAKADRQDCDFVSRCFGPAVGVDEDPVTGSAHAGLGPLWAKRLGKNTLLAYQASQRGGQIEVDCLGDRVALRGKAVTVLKGELLV